MYRESNGEIIKKQSNNNRAYSRSCIQATDQTDIICTKYTQEQTQTQRATEYPITL